RGEDEVGDIGGGNVAASIGGVVVVLVRDALDGNLLAFLGVRERCPTENDVDVIRIGLAGPVAVRVTGLTGGVRIAIWVSVVHAVGGCDHDPGGDQRSTAELPLMGVLAVRLRGAE